MKDSAIHHSTPHCSRDPPQSHEEATGAPQLWFEPCQSPLLSLKCGYVRGRPPAPYRAREPSISAPAERVRTGRQGEWRTRKPPPRDAFCPPTSCLHRRMDDALRGRVALVFCPFCVNVCEVPATQLQGPAVGTDTWAPQAWWRQEDNGVNMCEEPWGYSLWHNFPDNRLTREHIWIFMLLNHSFETKGLMRQRVYRLL